jgi:hypothetical protein
MAVCYEEVGRQFGQGHGRSMRAKRLVGRPMAGALALAVHLVPRGFRD